MKPICLLNESGDFSEKASFILQSRFLVMPADVCLELDFDAVEVLFVRLQEFIGEEKLKQYPNLKYLCSPTTGLNHIDLKFCHANNITVLSLQGEVGFLTECISATAEYTWGLFLSAWRKIVLAESDVRSGHWRRDKFRSEQLKGKTINILGMGRVGKRLVKYAKAFDLNVKYYDPDVSELDGKCASLNDLFENAKILIICCSYNNITHDIVNSKLLARLSDGALVVNTARGEIVDENAILECVKSKKLHYAADVIRNEQNFQVIRKTDEFFDSSLRSNILLTPHIAGACNDAMLLTEDFIANKLMDTICSTD